MGWNDIMFDKNGNVAPKNEVKPYSIEDKKKADKISLNLDDWENYKEYFKLEEYADKEC